MDYLDIVVHVFTPETRDFYRLEALWAMPRRVFDPAAARRRRLASDRGANPSGPGLALHRDGAARLRQAAR